MRRGAAIQKKRAGPIGPMSKKDNTQILAKKISTDTTVVEESKNEADADVFLVNYYENGEIS